MSFVFDCRKEAVEAIKMKRVSNLCVYKILDKEKNGYVARDQLLYAL